MKIPIRFFAIGLFTAAFIALIVYLITGDRQTSADDLPKEELIASIEEQGYRVITQDEYISYTVYRDEMKEKEEAEKEQNKNDSQAKATDQKEASKAEKEKAEADKQQATDKDEKQKETVRKVKIKVKEGMVSQDIAKKLKAEKIIDDEKKFVKYMEDNDYSAYIQIGTFTLKSDMTLKEIAETLTTYPGN